jgi:hypothetical protein
MEYNVTQWLPDNGEIVLCFGHRTYCCVEDMEIEPDWHEVIFSFDVSSYKIKKELPVDPEESILEFCETVEHWRIADDEEPREHVIGVSKWKKLK